jgi:streptomycin 6-kinase
MDELSIPDAVVTMNLAAHGEAGRAWLDSLPVLLAELRDRWRLSVGRPYAGGAVAFVAPAEREDGERVVLKVSFVEEETRNEADALALWDGVGVVRLLDADRDRGALLLERLEPGTSLEEHPDRDEAISIACRLLRRLWRPVPGPHPFSLVTDVARRWAVELPERFERLDVLFEPSLVDQAVALCLERSASNEDQVLANRDFHLGNVLAARREPWLLIDPKPLVGEPAFDTGHFLRSLLRNASSTSHAGELTRQLASELGLDPEHVRQWAFIRSVEDVLWGLAVGSGVEWDLECARALAYSTGTSG